MQETENIIPGKCACGCGESIPIRQTTQHIPLHYKPGHHMRGKVRKRPSEDMRYKNTVIPGIRLRDKNAVIVELNFPEQKTKLQDIMTSNLGKKKELLKHYSGVNLCCLCGKIPNYQIRYPHEGCVVIENYCSSCMNSVYFRG